MKCMVANARSLKNKILDFQTSVYAGDFDIATITETWLNDSILDHVLLPTCYVYNIFLKKELVIQLFQ